MNTQLDESIGPFSDAIYNDTNLTDEQITAIAEHFNIEPDEIEQSTYDDNAYEFDGCEYLVFDSYDDAENAAKESIENFFEEMPTGFSSWALCDNMPNDISLESVEDLIKADMSEVIKELVNLDGLVEDCISSDGIAHTLASYDGHELEIEDLYLYRTN